MVSSLLDEGIVDRRPVRLQEQIDEMAEGGLGDLSEEMRIRLRTAVPGLEELCAELAGSPIPSTLVHGDGLAGNVVVADGRYTIFDWTDACIAHPFTDLATYLHMFGPPSTDVAVRDQLRDRHLQGWSDLMPYDDAATLFEGTEPVAAMHHAISYEDPECARSEPVRGMGVAPTVVVGESAGAGEVIVFPRPARLEIQPRRRWVDFQWSFFGKGER